MTTKTSGVSRHLLGRGNSKLGSRILTFSIPAVSTCPGRSKLCESVCYAHKGRMMGLQTRVFARRLTATKKKSFTRKIVAEILASQRKIVRIHVSGDFYSTAYVQKWLAVAQACPDVRFYAYTRSWRDPEIRANLEQLSKCRNVRLWYSCDAETGQPARVPKRVRIAYMAMKDSDLPVKKTDLVFRVERKTVLKHQDGFLVCPLENGITHTTDCGRCSLCITPEVKDPRRYALTIIDRARDA